jgi:hypothetical protein
MSQRLFEKPCLGTKVVDQRPRDPALTSCLRRGGSSDGWRISWITGQVGRRENEQRALALLDRALELDQTRHAQREGVLRVIACASIVQRVEQKAVDPRAILLGVGDEHVAGFCKHTDNYRTRECR